MEAPQLFQAALYYVETLGFSVIPIIPGEKRPAIPWTEYQQRRPTRDELVEWFHEGDYQLGIVCGKVSGNLVVLDFETPAAYEEWASRHQELAGATRTVTTGKGVHVYFKLGKPPAGNTKLVPGLVETRGEGGMVLAPPSLHPSGKRYALRGQVRDVARVAWEDISNGENWESKDGSKLSAVEAAKTLVAGNKAGRRNDAVFNAAVLLRDKGKPIEETLGILLESNERNDPPLDIGEVERTVKSAYSKEAPARLLCFDEAMRAVKALREQQVRSWAKMPRDTSLTADYWLGEVKKIVKDCGGLKDDEFEILLQELEKKPEPLIDKKRRELKKIWNLAGKAAQLLSGGAQVAPGERPKSWPYDIKKGRIVYLSERTFYESTIVQSLTVADFEAHITHEIQDEDGLTTYVVAGQSVRSGPFEIEIEAEDFGSDYRLKARLEAASGAMDPVRAGMGKHLCTAIKKLTTGAKRITRYKRTGWADGRFLMPGRGPDSIMIELKRKLAFEQNSEADLTLGLDALEALIQSMGPERSTVALATFFQAPIMRIAGWDNERYALFISGRTGSLKTSFAQVALCIYGADFINDVNLIKWGEGATHTSVMLYAAMAHDMPLLIDNYKPNTGKGSQDFINIIHNIVEGGDKDRANRNAELRETKPLYCLPICTGEDVPGNDPASLARILVVPFKWQRGEDNKYLTKAQQFSCHLPAVGATWFDWLESKEGRESVVSIGGKFEEYRARWAVTLRDIRRDSVNILRVASNLATNQLTWEALCQVPALSDLAERYLDDHVVGLTEIVAVTMAEATAEALEATRYIAALRELFTTGRILILPREEPPMQTETERIEIEQQKDRIIGWFDEDGVYLLPLMARQAVERLLGPDSMNNVSNVSLFKQLDELDFVVSKGKNRIDKSMRIRGRVRAVVHLKPDALTSDGDLPCKDPLDGQEIAEKMPF